MKRALAAGVVLALASLALANWYDGFEGYSLGSINGQGGWKGWDNTPAAAGIVTNAIAFGGTQSQQINGPADSVQTYTGYNAGQWVYTANMYVPTNFTGTSYFILLNTYNDSGPYDWSVQLPFNATTNQVTDDMRTATPLPIVRGAWVPIRVEIDLDANLCSVFYNNQSLSSGTWTTGTGSALNIAAVDLYANSASAVYYDDMSLVPEPAALALLGLLAVLRRR